MITFHKMVTLTVFFIIAFIGHYCEAAVMTLAEAPAAVGLNISPESDSSIFAFSEGVHSVVDVPIDFKTNGTETTISDAPALPANSLSGEFESWYLRFDPVGDPTVLVPVTGMITFETEIVALVLKGITVRDTHVALGAPGTDYELGIASFRGLETGDSVTISADNKTLTLDLGAGIGDAGIDQLRVLVAVPEPNSLFLACMAVVVGILFLGRQREFNRVR